MLHAKNAGTPKHTPGKFRLARQMNLQPDFINAKHANTRGENTNKILHLRFRSSRYAHSGILDYTLEGENILRISVLVKTNAARTEVLSYLNAEKQMTVEIAEPAVKNKADIALLKLLKKHFGKPARLVQGATNRRKIIEISE